LYEGLAAEGYGYGPAFRGLKAAWRREGDVFAEIVLPEAGGDAAEFGVHPALLDAALHALGADPRAAGPTRLPFAWGGVVVHAAGARALRVALAWTGPDSVSLRAADEAGVPVLSAESLVLRPAAGMAAGAAGGAGAEWLFGVEWVPVPAPAAEAVAAVADAGWAELSPAQVAEGAAEDGAAAGAGTVVVSWPVPDGGADVAGGGAGVGAGAAGAGAAGGGAFAAAASAAALRFCTTCM